MERRRCGETKHTCSVQYVLDDCPRNGTIGEEANGSPLLHHHVKRIRSGDHFLLRVNIGSIRDVLRIVVVFV